MSATQKFARKRVVALDCLMKVRKCASEKCDMNGVKGEMI